MLKLFKNIKEGTEAKPIKSSNHQSIQSLKYSIFIKFLQ